MIKCKCHCLDMFGTCNKIEEYYNNYDVIDLKIMPRAGSSFYLFIIYH